MKIIDALLSLLYPKKCPFCQKLIDEDRLLCRSCQSRLPFIPAATQPRLLPNVDACYSVLYYQDSVRQSILRYKFGGAASYAEIYSHFLGKCIDENGITCDIITWVPLSRARLRKRGYDQARLLAEGISLITGTECVPMLRKIRNNPAQSGTKDAAARKKNVSGVYVSCADCSPSGKSVLIIDDIVTTGSTLSECARILKNEGASRVTALTLAAAVQ